MADEEEGDKGLRDTLGSLKSSIGSIGDSSDVAEEVESGDLEPKPGLVLDISDYQVTFPQNKDEAEAEWLDQMAGNLIGEELIKQYRQGDQGGIEVLISDVEQFMQSAEGIGSIEEVMERNRRNLQNTLDELEQELEIESEEEELLDDWSVRLTRVLTLIDSVHRQLPDNLADMTEEDARKIVIGDEPYGLSSSALDSGMQGLTFGAASRAVDDWGIKYSSSTYSRENRYGLAHALEDLQNINNQVLSPLISEVSEEVEGKRDTFDSMAKIIESNEELFLQLMKIRLNIQQLEDRENVADQIAEEIQGGDADSQVVEQNMSALLEKVESEEEETYELDSKSDQLLRQEAWMVEAFERAHNIMEQSFNVVDHVVEDDDRLRSRIEGQTGPARPYEFLQRLQSAFPEGNLSNMAGNVVEEFKNMQVKGREVERLEVTDIENLLIMDRRIANTLEKIESAEQLEKKLEEMEDEEYSSISEIEREKSRKVRAAVGDIDRILENEFGSVSKENLAEEFEQAREELEEAGMELEELESTKEGDVKDDSQIEETLEYVGKALEELESDLTRDFSFGTPKVGISFTHNGESHILEGTLDEVLHEIIGKLGELDDSISRKVEKEDGEEKDLFQAVEEFRDAYQEVEKMAEGWKKIHERIEQLKSELSELPDDYKKEAMQEFKMEMDMLDEEKVYDYMKEFSEGRGRDMLEAAEGLLEDISHEDQQEAKLLDEVSKVDKKEDQRVKELIQILQEHEGQLPESSDSIEMLERIHSILGDINEKKGSVKEDISEELDLTEKTSSEVEDFFTD